MGGETMGTSWAATFFAPPSLDTDALKQHVEDMFNHVTSELSNWDTASVVSRFNRAPGGSQVSLSRTFSAVLATAIDIAGESDGAFNPCLGDRVGGLSFGSPSISKQHRLTGPDHDWRDIPFDQATGVLTQPGGLMLDLSAIAKGFAVDRMGQLFGRAGVGSYLVEIGGEFVGVGTKPDGMPWWVSLTGDQDDGPVVALCGQALATSGLGYRFYAGEGSHIVGTHEDDLTWVSVVHPSCMIADGWATAIFAQGARAGIATANRLGVAVLCRHRDATWQASDEMRRMMA